MTYEEINTAALAYTHQIGKSFETPTWQTVHNAFIAGIITAQEGAHYQ
jgi:hypothetical protein